MSQESTTPDLVGLWQEAADAVDRRNFDAAMRVFAPDAVWEVQPLGISHRGAPAIRSFLEEWLGSYEDYEYDHEEGLDLGNGVVFAVVVQEAVPAGSAGHGHFRQREGWVFLWERGLIARLSAYDPDEARAAAERLAEERG